MISLGRRGRPLRIGYGRIFHEACAYSPITTEREDFLRMHHLSGVELARAVTWKGKEFEGYMPHAELTGFAAAARLAGGVETIPLESSLAIPSGPLSPECFESLIVGMEHQVAKAGDLDGIYLALHGSMQVHGLDEAPEAVIIQRVRAAAPTGVRIAVSYDLHAHLTPGLVDPVDVLIAYRSNPHWDLYPTGFRAGNRLIRALRGEIKPVHAWRKLPMVLGGGLTISFLSPMRQVFRFMKKMERDPKVLSASLFMVHPYTASDELGWAVHVSTDDDEALANRLAEELADRAWAQRNAALPPIEPAAAALDRIENRQGWRPGPVSLLDIDDIVGAGAPGGNTRVIEALLARDRGLETFVPLHDPEAIDALWGTALGKERDITLRGTPGYDQPPLSLCVKVAAKIQSDFGRAIRVDAGKIKIAITERPPLPIHPRFWRELGLEPRRADILVQKNFFHYRMFYATTSFEHIGATTQGATSFERIKTRKYRRPTHPQVQLGDWRMEA